MVTNTASHSQVIIAQDYGSVSVAFTPASITSIDDSNNLIIKGANITVRGTGPGKNSYGQVGGISPSYSLYVLN